MRAVSKWLVLAVALGLLAMSGISAGRPSESTGIARAQEVANDHAVALLDLPHINGVGASLEANGLAVVLVLTERAGVSGIPRELDGVRVVTRVAGKIVALAPPPAGASFTATCSSLTCNLDGSGSTGRRLSFDWDFGDGNTGSGEVVSHTYSVDGTYPVSLTVTDKNGNTDIATQSVEVSDGGGGGGGGHDCFATGDTTARCDRPVPIGVSTGHPSITAGTIGARVTDGTDVYALSNNHVYAASNGATIGDNVLQPGTFDGGADPADAIGTLFDFEPIVFGGALNTIDAAIALSSTNDLDNATPSDGYGTPKSSTVAASINQKVKKYGRTTGQTKGTVQGIGFTVDVNYGSAGVARFVNQIVIGPGSFSAGGDSGSLIVDDGKGRRGGNNGKPVGLLFAGSVFFTIANPIDTVLDRFGVTVDGQ